ncbi:MAG: 4-alpha-glucanotransferase, partial [Bacteroidales bacterium]|nr:4-alpha-glucanotransferase [Bacteroidales bacterium]
VPEKSGLMGHFSPALPYATGELEAMRLPKELFLQDPHRTGRWHPRINGRKTAAYAALDEDRKRAFDALYDDFFYRRNNHYWKMQALRKLPELLGATGMLACGEDLGMIPACVPEVMDAQKILSLEIQRMPKDPGQTFADPARYPYLCVCTTSTHDMTPLRAWWEEEDPVLVQRYFREVLGQNGPVPASLTPELSEPQLRVHAQPVLQRQNGEHGRRSQVLRDDLLADIGLAVGRGLARPAQHLVVVALDQAAVFLLPPGPERAHVMGGSRTDAHVRIFRRNGEGLVRVLRHALDLEGKYPLRIHHLRHAGRDHAEILAAGEHTGRTQQLRQLAHGLMLPELVVTAVEEVVVQLVERPFLPVVEMLERLRVTAVDARVPEALVVRILQEQAVHGQSPVGNLLQGIRHRRAEMPHQAALLRHGNLPDAEESQDMVDAECVEVLRHLAQAALPPRIVILGHLVPVVGRESPVLPVHGKRIRRCAALRIHVEQVGMAPCIHARAADADGQVALEHHALAVRIGADLLELLVEVVLHEAMVIHLGLVPGVVVLRLLQAVLGVRTPLREVRRAGLIAQRAENGIRQQPVGIGREEVAVILAREHLLPLRTCEDRLQKLRLRLVDFHIVNLLQGIELRPLLLERGRHLHPRRRQVDELRMQRKSGIGIVRIRIHPLVRHRRIVDRQQLQHGLAGHRRPVRHLLQVVELAHSEPVVAPQCEYRNRSARSAESRAVEDRGRVLPQEAVAARRHIVPRIAERSLAPRGLAAVMPPLLPHDDPVADHFIRIVQQHGARELVDLDSPEAALAVLHGVFPALAHQKQILSPLSVVFNSESCFHNRMRLVRSKYSKNVGEKDSRTPVFPTNSRNNPPKCIPGATNGKIPSTRTKKKLH